MGQKMTIMFWRKQSRIARIVKEMNLDENDAIRVRVISCMVIKHPSLILPIIHDSLLQSYIYRISQTRTCFAIKTTPMSRYTKTSMSGNMVYSAVPRKC